jgi:hypothetical protein
LFACLFVCFFWLFFLNNFKPQLICFQTILTK